MSLPKDRDILIDRAVAGDMKAMESLLSDHYNRLLKYVADYLSPKLRGAIDPQDIVQDTCFEACRLIAGFRNDGDDCMYRWLVTIARHRIIKCARRRRPQRIGDTPGEDEAVAALLEQLSVYRRTPSRSAASHEFMARLENTLERLPTDYREVVKLRHLQGLSSTETAEKMSLSIETVYVLCSRALRLIREDLKSASRFM